MSDHDTRFDANPQRAAWEAGDYGRAARQSLLASELICEVVGLRANERVLDVACGTGVTALAAARRYADVDGIDFSTNALAAARGQAEFEGLDNVAFIEGYAEALPYEDGMFDVVLSTFGVQFVSNQEAAARELIRVCRSGGRIGLANWSPRGFFGHFFKLMADYAPPPMQKMPTPARPGVLWGTEERLEELFGGHVEFTSIEKRTSRSRYRSAEEWLHVTRQSLGPMTQIIEQIDANRRTAFIHELLDLVRSMNVVPGPDVMLESEYLEVVMVRR
jgi:ubiquinone/menaquinone biosynthesis C-methylase UbiE